MVPYLGFKTYFKVEHSPPPEDAIPRRSLSYFWGHRHLVLFTLTISGLLTTGCLSDNPVDRFHAGLPCTTDLVSTGTFLNVDSTVEVADLAPRLTMNSTGQFFGSPIEGGKIIVWSPSGELQASIGRPGEGPGELFEGGLLSIYVTENDTLYVKDGRFRWHVFSPSGEFFRSSQTGPINGAMGYTHFLPDGRIVSSYPRRRAPGTFLFHIATRDGEWSRGIAEVDSNTYRLAAGRQMTGGANGSFWVAPANLTIDGYRLERWDTTGVMVDSIIADVPWVRRNPSTQLAEFPAFPTVTSMYADSHRDLLLVGLMAPKTPWRRGFDTMPVDDQMRGVDAYLDVFDLSTHKLLSSTRFLDLELAPVGLLRSSELGYRAFEDSLTGLTTIEIVRLELQCNPDRKEVT